ncbi:unnamed protein product [Rotaria sp. Silwood2]|nr:unnamed protein product [Rotaria sp. Silwood2]
MWNSQSIVQQQQRLAHVLAIVQDLKALSMLPLLTNLDLIQEIQTISTATRPFIPSPTNGLSLSTELF